MKHYLKPGEPFPFAFELDGSQDHLITADMVPCDPPAPPPPPTQAELALAQIRQLEAAHSDTQARVTRIALLDLAVEKAVNLLKAQVTLAVNAQPGLTEQQRADLLAAQLANITPEYAHAQLMLLDKAYKATFLLEEQVEALRDVIKNST